MNSATGLKPKLISLVIFFSVAAWGQAPQASPNAVRLAINYGDGVQKEFRLPWKQDMTVFDAMNLAQANPHGIKFAYEGSTPDKYFLTQIDDVKNEGSGTGKRNWLYSVNAIPAKESFGLYKLKAADRVSWTFSSAHLKSQGQRRK